MTECIVIGRADIGGAPSYVRGTRRTTVPVRPPTAAAPSDLPTITKRFGRPVSEPLGSSPGRRLPGITGTGRARENARS